MTENETTFRAPRTVAAGIERAIRLIRARPQLARGMFFDAATECYCVAGALNQAFTGHSYDMPETPLLKQAFRALVLAIRNSYTVPRAKRNETIFNWNDAKDRTKQQAVRALRDAKALVA